MGMDSLTAMEVRTKLQASLAVSLPATLAFDYGTLDALADFLLRGKLDQESPTARRPRNAADRTPPPGDDGADVGGRGGGAARRQSC